MCYSLINGDFQEELSNIEDNSVDLILTDPPYNLANYSTGNMHFDWRSEINNDVALWDKKPFSPDVLVKDFQRVLKPTGNIFIFCSYNLLGKYHECFDSVFDTFQFMVWHKTNPVPNIRKSSFLNSCELIVCCWNKGHKWNFTKQNEMHIFFESGICMGKERIKGIDGKTLHPTQKPVKVLSHIIKLATDEGDTVLDCFNGVGSTGDAALSMNRNYIGIEIDPEYCAAIRERLEKFDASSSVEEASRELDIVTS